MLAQKKVPVDYKCPVCKCADETAVHVLVRCPVAVQCWQTVIPEVVCGADQDLPQWWEKVFAACNNDKRAEIATISWSLWKARNELVWNNMYTRSNVVIALAKQYLVQWRFAQKSNINTLNPNLEEGDGAVVWAKPQIDTIKISVDAATFEEFEASGIGMVARDSKGDLILARTIRLTSRLSVVMVEAIAIKEALSWIKKQNWQQVVVEPDSLVVVQAVRSKVPMVSPFGQVIEECRYLLQELNTISLLFVKRSANMAVHELARVSYSLPDRIFNRTSIPIAVLEVILVDAN